MIKPLRKLGQCVGADEVGPECKITVFYLPFYPNQLIAHCQAHCSGAINVKGQDEDILNSCARDVRKKSL